MDTVVADAPALTENRRVDTVVVGSGIAGLSTAYELACRGQKVIVLDRGRIAGGMTSRTSAHLTSQSDDGFKTLIQARGLDGARTFYESHAAAIDRIQAIAEDEGIDCHFRRVNGYFFLQSGKIQQRNLLLNLRRRRKSECRSNVIPACHLKAWKKSEACAIPIWRRSIHYCICVASLIRLPGEVENCSRTPR